MKAVLPLTLSIFESTEAAQRALSALSGQDIYAGCCTLKIDYSKVNIYGSRSLLFTIFSSSVDCVSNTIGL